MGSLKNNMSLTRQEEVLVCLSSIPSLVLFDEIDLRRLRLAAFHSP